MTTDTPLSSDPTQRVDVRLKYVRVLERRPDVRVVSEPCPDLAGLIEDEAIIAMDIQMIITEIGHRVTGIARNRIVARAYESAGLAPGEIEPFKLAA